MDERLQIAIQSTEDDIKKIFKQEGTVWTQDITYVEQLGQCVHHDNHVSNFLQHKQIVKWEVRVHIPGYGLAFVICHTPWRF